MRLIIYIIITVIVGLSVIGFFLELKRMLKRNSPHSYLVFFTLWMCMMIFILLTCRIIIGIIEKFYSIWIAGPTGSGVSILLAIALIKLVDQEIDKLDKREKKHSKIQKGG